MNNNPCEDCNNLECKFEMREPCKKAIAWKKLDDEFYEKKRYVPKGIGKGFGDWHDRQSEIKGLR